MYTQLYTINNTSCKAINWNGKWEIQSVREGINEIGRTRYTHGRASRNFSQYLTASESEEWWYSRTMLDWPRGGLSDSCVDPAGDDFGGDEAGVRYNGAVVIISRKESSWRSDSALCSVSSGLMGGTPPKPSIAVWWIRKKEDSNILNVIRFDTIVFYVDQKDHERQNRTRRVKLLGF